MAEQKPKPELTEDDFARIANEIHRIGDLGRKMKNSGLAPRAIWLLIADYTGVPMSTIRVVLEALPELSTKYLRAARK